jgi:hypothetical protein
LYVLRCVCLFACVDSSLIEENFVLLNAEYLYLSI